MGAIADAARLHQPAKIIAESSSIGDRAYALAAEAQSLAKLFNSLESSCEDDEDRVVIKDREAALVARIRAGVQFTAAEKARILGIFAAVFAE